MQLVFVAVHTLGETTICRREHRDDGAVHVKDEVVLVVLCEAA